MIKVLGVVFLLFFISKPALAMTDLQAYIAMGCENFKTSLKQIPNTTSGYLEVPKYWNSQGGEKIPIFWWKRAGRDQSFPPLIFIHGGPGANSWAAPVKLKTLLEQYPGDFLSIDERGEGCSSTLPGNLPPKAYNYLRTRNIVYDLEHVRKTFYKNQKWRVFGQSRGSAIIHYYLEMFPEFLESAHAQGWSVLPSDLAFKFTHLRAYGYYRTAEAYGRKYPQDIELIHKIRQSIPSVMCWHGYEGRKYCGGDVFDIYGYDLSRVSLWENLHKTLQSTLKPDGTLDSAMVYQIIADHVKTDLFANANYIMGTFAQDFNYPNLLILSSLVGSSIIEKPLLSEVRYWINVIAPATHLLWSSSADPVNYLKIRSFLSKNLNFKYFLYAGGLDPVGPIEMNEYEVSVLSPYVHYRGFPDAGHDAWYSQPEITRQLLQR